MGVAFTNRLFRRRSILFTCSVSAATTAEPRGAIDLAVEATADIDIERTTAIDTDAEVTVDAANDIRVTLGSEADASVVIHAEREGGGDRRARHGCHGGRRRNCRCRCHHRDRDRSDRVTERALSTHESFY